MIVAWVALAGAESTGRTFVRARLQRDGDGWVQEHTVCGAVVGGAMVKTRVPEAYTRSVPVKTYPAQITAGRYRADLQVFRTGHHASCASVPETAEDPCVFDWDDDGHPGATIEVNAPLFSWVEVYVAQRNHILLDGAFISSDRIEGALTVLDLQNHVLGASRSLFDRNPTAEVVPESSGFEMTRMPDDADCAAVLEKLQE